MLSEVLKTIEEGEHMNELRELLLSGNVSDYVNALIDLYLNLKMK